MKKTHLFLGIIFLVINVNYVFAQDEFKLLGLSEIEVRYELGAPHHKSDVGYGLYELVYNNYKDGYLFLRYSLLRDECYTVTVESKIMTRTKATDFRDYIMNLLASYGFKLFEKRNNPEVWVLFTPLYLANLQVCYRGGNKGGFDDYALKVTYLKNIFN